VATAIHGNAWVGGSMKAKDGPTRWQRSSSSQFFPPPHIPWKEGKKERQTKLRLTLGAAAPNRDPLPAACPHEQESLRSTVLLLSTTPPLPPGPIRRWNGFPCARNAWRLHLPSAAVRLYNMINALELLIFPLPSHQRAFPKLDGDQPCRC